MLTLDKFVRLARLREGQNRLDDDTHAPGLDQTGDFNKLCSVRMQAWVARPHGYTNFGGVFGGVVAQVHWNQPAATLEHIQQTILARTTYRIIDQINIVSHLFYRSG